MANCKYCAAEITWLKDGRKNIPANLDSTPHECEEFRNAKNSTVRMGRSEITPEEIARYEEAINKKKKK